MRRGQLMPKDLEVLRFLARFGVATADMVHRELFVEQLLRNAYRRLEVLKDHRLVKHQRIFWRKPGVWWATGAGARLSGVELDPYTFQMLRLNHTLEQVTLYQAVVESGEGFLRWQTEREVRKQTSEKPIPDALVAFEPNLWTALELELVNKRSRRYAELFRSYANKQDLHGVRYYFESEAGARRAAQIAAEVSADVPTPAGYFSFYKFRPEGFLSEAPRRPPDAQSVRYLDAVPSPSYASH